MSSVAAGAAAPESPEKESADRQAPELNPRTDAWGRAAQRLKRNPFDYDAWMLIVEEAKVSHGTRVCVCVCGCV